MIKRWIAKRSLFVAMTAAMCLCVTSTARASDIGADIANQIVLVMIVGVSFALAAITIGIVHASTKNKRVWLGYPLALLAWGALLYVLLFVVL